MAGRRGHEWVSVWHLLKKHVRLAAAPVQDRDDGNKCLQPCQPLLAAKQTEVHAVARASKSPRFYLTCPCVP